MIQPNEISVFWNLAASDKPERRHASWGIHRSWDNVLAEMQVQYEWGVRAFDWWLPFGHDGEWPFEVSAARWNRYNDTCPEPMRPWNVEAVMRRWMNEHPDTLLRVYLGDMEHDPELSKVDNDPDQWNEIITDSFKPVLDAGVRHIGLDRSATYAEDSSWALEIQRLARQGVEVYLEAWPQHEWQKGYNVIGRLAGLHRQNPAVYSDASGLDPSVVGNVVAYCLNEQHVERALSYGWVPSINVGTIRRLMSA